MANHFDLGRFDLFDDLAELPLVGKVPVVGTLLRVPTLMAGAWANAMTPENSRVRDYASKNGIISSFNKRSDINPWAKIGMETVAGVVPDAAVGKLLEIPAALRAAGGLNGLADLAQGSGKVLASQRLTDPLIDATKWLGGKVLDTKVGAPVRWLGERSHKGLSNLHSAWTNYALNEAVAKGADVATLRRAIADAASGARSHADIGFEIGIGDIPMQRLATLESFLGTPKLDRLAATSPDAATFTKGTLTALDEALVGALRKRSGLERAWDKGTSVAREGMLSGISTPQNVMDILTKGLIERVSPIDLVRAMAQGDKYQPMKAIMGSNHIPAPLGLNTTVTGMLGSPKSESVIGNAPSALMAAIGGGLGGIAGGPVGAIAGAGQGLLTKYGLKTNLAMMSAAEKARQAYMAQGYLRYFTEKAPSFIKPQFRQAAFDQIDTLMGPQAGDFARWLKSRNFAATAEDVANEATARGLPASSVDEIYDLWRNVHDEAVRGAINFSNKSQFDYLGETNLEMVLRKAGVPFPTWPTKNLPYYLENSVRYPIIPAEIASAHEKSKQYGDNLGLTYRFNDRLPLLNLPGGSLWADPMAPLSVAGQLNEPFPRSADHQMSIPEWAGSLGLPEALGGKKLPEGVDPNKVVTPLDSALDAMGGLGLGLAPTTTMPLQALGLINRGEDFGNSLPWTNVFGPLASAIKGEPVDMETVLKAPFEGIRERVQPGAGGDTSYLEYQVRKRIAEKAIAETGTAWWANAQEHPEYMQAMVEPSSPIRQAAVREAAAQQAPLWLERRVLPFSQSYLPTEEAQIRATKKQLGPIPEGLANADYAQIRDENPIAYGYRGTSTPENQLNLQIKQDFYYSLNKAQQKAFLSQNPDLLAWLNYSGAEKKAGRNADMRYFLDTFQKR